MPRYRLVIEYHGQPFVGWQIQANGPSVQGALTAAVAAFSGEQTTVYGAGRTDAGVHALGQVAHLDLVRDWQPDRVRDALNAQLRPHPIAVLAVEGVADSFDARFSAIRRHYLYRIINRRADLALDRGRAWRVPVRLDVAAMHEAAQLLVGRHDFTTFRSAECQARSAEKTLDRLTVERRGEEIEITAAARSFLHHQVRSMAGSLACVGARKWGVDDMAKALARDPAAPAVRSPHPKGFIWSRWTIPTSILAELGTKRARPAMPADIAQRVLYAFVGIEVGERRPSSGYAAVAPLRA